MNASQIDRSARGRGTRAAIIFIMVTAAGCTVAPSATKYKHEIHPREDVVATQEQLRLRMRALAEPLSGHVVESADRIIAGTTNRAVQREALLWKIEAVPAIREALFRPDPFTAVTDIWVLAWQMNDYFESGRGKQALAESASIAVKACQEMEAEVNTVAASLTRSGDVSDVRKFAQQWAKEHPIHASIGGRESLVSLALERKTPASFSAQRAAGTALETMDDLTRRLDVYSVQLFDQARWQAELVAMNLASEYQLEKAMPLADKAVQSAAEAVAILKRLEPALNDTLAVAKSTPEVIGRERAAALQSITKEREATMKELRETIAAERATALEYITKERQATMKDLRQTLVDEHKALTDDVEKIGGRQVDHAVFRVSQLTFTALAAIFVGVAVLIWIARRIFVGRRTLGER